MPGPTSAVVAAGAAARAGGGQETPETWEHSVEVQVPFLQKVLKSFTLLPVVIGEADPGSGQSARRED